MFNGIGELLNCTDCNESYLSDRAHLTTLDSKNLPLEFIGQSSPDGTPFFFSSGRQTSMVKVVFVNIAPCCLIL